MRHEGPGAADSGGDGVGLLWLSTSTILVTAETPSLRERAVGHLGRAAFACPYHPGFSRRGQPLGANQLAGVLEVLGERFMKLMCALRSSGGHLPTAQSPPPRGDSSSA